MKPNYHLSVCFPPPPPSSSNCAALHSRPISILTLSKFNVYEFFFHFTDAHRPHDKQRVGNDDASGEANNTPGTIKTTSAALRRRCRHQHNIVLYCVSETIGVVFQAYLIKWPNQRIL